MAANIEIGRFSIPYAVYGQGKPCIICINGAQQSMAVWRTFITHFSGKASVVVFDFPGQARAVIHYGPEEITFDEQTTVIRAVKEQVSPYEKVCLFGASWGGIITARFAATYPEMVDKVILASFGVRPTNLLKDIISRGHVMYQNAQAQKTGQLMMESFGQRLPDFWKEKIIRQFEHMPEDQFLSFKAHTESVDKINHISDVVDLSRINSEVLIINGMEDTLLDPHDAITAATMIHNCRLRLVENAGHFLHFERQEIMNLYSDFFLNDNHGDEGIEENRDESRHHVNK